MRRGLLALLFGLIVVPAFAQDRVRPEVPAFKGIELYSWKDPNSGRWQFSLLGGTNRLKTLNEIQAGDKVIPGIVLLKQHLALLAKGEQVFWSKARFPELSFPPAEIVGDILKFAEARGVKVWLGQ